MRQVLLILTQSLDPLNDIVTGIEPTLPDVRTEVIDLTIDQPDYQRLLTAIFAADSVQVW